MSKSLAIAGAVHPGWIALQALHEGLSPMPTFDPSAAAVSRRSAVTSGAALSLAKPQNITYWPGLGGTATAPGVTNPGWTAFAVFLVDFMASFIGPRTGIVLNVRCAVGLAYFAGLVLLRTLAEGRLRRRLTLTHEPEGWVE